MPDNLKIEIVASEPLVADPAGIAWDERGRLFVCEIHGYNLEGHLDVEELNKSGVLDREVRRIQANPKIKAAAKAGIHGTVKLLTDTDKDGRMDRVDVWADDLPPCHGIIAARGGVIVTCRPEIVFLADRDNDGKAEVREVLFTGFRGELLERAINTPRWGLDNWIYVAPGGGGGVISGPHLKKLVQLSDTGFRMLPDGSAIEPVTGGMGTFGLTMNDWGDRFLISTKSPCYYPPPLPYRDLARNPYVPLTTGLVNAADYNRVYPASQPHPWRLERGQQKAWLQFYGTGEATPNGYFTSACGQNLYRAELLPEEYRGNLFCCEPSQNMIHRCLMERHGLRFGPSGTGRRKGGISQFDRSVVSTDESVDRA